MTPELALLLKATVVLVFGLIGARLAARARASVRHLLLASTLGALVALPAVAVVVPELVVAIQLPAAAMSAAPADATRSSGYVAAAPTLAERFSVAAASVDDARRGLVPSTAGISMATTLLVLWMAGAVVLLAVLANALRKVRAVRRGGIPWLAGQTTVDALARERRIRRPLSVILHEDVPAPVTCGWRRPAIMLPADAREWSESDLQRAFVHELEHVRRHDWPIQLAARAICAAYWFHPLVWIAWRQLCLECERACDDAVIDREDQADYAQQLVTLAERLAHSQAHPVLSMANRSDLSVRVRAVLDRTQLRGRAGASIVTATLATATIAVLVIAPVQVAATDAVASAEAAVPEAQVRANTASTRINATSRALGRALVEAATEGDIGEVSALLNAGVDVNAVVRGDGTALLIAAREGDRELVRLLLDRGADVNLGVSGDGNPLIMAAREGYLEIVRMLVASGADVNAGVRGDGNALIMAAREGYLDIVRTLLDSGADVNAAVRGDGNALIMAAREGYVDIVTLLLDRGAGIEEVVPGDENALISGSASGYLDVVRLLVSRGADVNARVWAEVGWPVQRGEWRTPLSMARRGGHSAVVRYLQSVGAVD
jgi:beta-lactamase regulating signal transducer with metallopeptidase domain/ankyrin repeat protein